jgi:hypothetical protein
MVLKQKGKPEKGKKPVRGGPRQFSDHREFPDGPVEEFENLRVRNEETSGSESEENDSEVESSEGEPIVPNKPVSKPSSTAKPTGTAKAPASAAPSNGKAPEMSRREREAIQKEQARQHYMKMKEKEDAARLALIRKQREEAAAAHAEALKAKEAAKRR